MENISLASERMFSQKMPTSSVCFLIRKSNVYQSIFYVFVKSVCDISPQLAHMQSKAHKQNNKCYTLLDQQVQMKIFHKASDKTHTSNFEKILAGGLV